MFRNGSHLKIKMWKLTIQIKTSQCATKKTQISIIWGCKRIQIIFLLFTSSIHFLHCRQWPSRWRDSTLSWNDKFIYLSSKLFFNGINCLFLLYRNFDDEFKLNRKRKWKWAFKYTKEQTYYQKRKRKKIKMSEFKKE